jgi:FixJ family two-component response regulator
MSTLKELVYLLDDEPEMIKALTRLLRAKSFEVQGFTSVRAFLDANLFDGVSCIVLDVAMPELNGLELQKRLLDEGSLMPIIFLTAHGDIPMSVRAMKAGATDFLTKPVEATELVEAVRSALNVSEERLRAQSDTSAWIRRLSTLTARQREVMEHIVNGLLNKQIAANLGTGEQNIKLHRAQIMRKMEVDSLAELVRIAERLGIGKDIHP